MQSRPVATICVALCASAATFMSVAAAGCGASGVECSDHQAWGNFVGTSNMEARGTWSCDDHHHYAVEYDCTQSGPFVTCSVDGVTGAPVQKVTSLPFANGVCNVCMSGSGDCVPDLATACRFPH